MEAGERDSTDDWVLAPEARPATWSELEGRVDYALAVAQASERAALEIGAAAIDAAEQARRAADLAADAAARQAEAREPEASAPPVEVEAPWSPVGRASADQPDLFDSLRHFTERADSVMARLRSLEPGAA